MTFFIYLIGYLLKEVFVKEALVFYSSEFISLIIEISFVQKFLYNLVEKYTIL